MLISTIIPNHNSKYRLNYNNKEKISISKNDLSHDFNAKTNNDLLLQKIPVSFNGLILFSPSKAVNTGQAFHKTYFFRDYEMLKQLKTCVKQYFPKGTNIDNFGVSSGEETYTIGMMLQDINREKIYSITGYDLDSDIIKIAKEGYHAIFDCVDPNGSDEFLNRVNVLKPLENECKKLFKKYFLPIEGFPEYSLLKRRMSDIIGTTKRDLGIDSCKDISYSCYKVNKKYFNEIINFELGNICNIDENLSTNTGVVIFKNGWHNLTYDRGKTYDDANFSLLENTIQKIGNRLLPNGLLAVGKLRSDHIVSYYAGNGQHFLTEESEKALSRTNDKFIVKIEDSPFHRILKLNGFEPIFYEKQLFYRKNGKKIEVNLPSIWKKSNNNPFNIA